MWLQTIGLPIEQVISKLDMLGGFKNQPVSGIMNKKQLLMFNMLTIPDINQVKDVFPKCCVEIISDGCVIKVVKF